MTLVENNNEDPKFKVGDHVNISKYQTLEKDMFQIGQKKNTVL